MERLKEKTQIWSKVLWADETREDMMDRTRSDRTKHNASAETPERGCEAQWWRDGDVGFAVTDWPRISSVDQNIQESKLGKTAQATSRQKPQNGPNMKNQHLGRVQNVFRMGLGEVQVGFGSGSGRVSQ